MILTGNGALPVHQVESPVRVLGRPGDEAERMVFAPCLALFGQTSCCDSRHSLFFSSSPTSQRTRTPDCTLARSTKISSITGVERNRTALWDRFPARRNRQNEDHKVLWIEKTRNKKRLGGLIFSCFFWTHDFLVCTNDRHRRKNHNLDSGATWVWRTSGIVCSERTSVHPVKRARMRSTYLVQNSWMTVNCRMCE